MKTFFSILILTSLALAQFTGTPKRGDATYIIDADGIISDSLNALSASNGIVYSGRDFKQKIVKNIATLQAYDVDSLGTTVYLREVTSGGYGGGEVVYVDSSDLKTRMGYAVADSVIIFHAPTSDRVWLRSAYANQRRINVTWAGAKGTNVITDSAANNIALTKAMRIALASGSRHLYFPDGDYYYTKPLRPYRAVNLGFIVEGDGSETTRLNFRGTGAAIDCDNGAVYDQQFVLRNLAIYGNTSIVAGSKGINFNLMGLARIDNVSINYLDIGIDMTGQANNWLIVNSGVARCSIGVEISGNANGGTIQNLENTNHYGIGIYIHNGGSGWTIDAGESGSNAIAALKVEDAGLGTVIGHNFESGSDSADVILVNNANVNFVGTKFLEGDGNWAVWAQTANANFLYCTMSGYPKTRMVKASDNFCNFTGISTKNSEIVVNDQGSLFWTIGPFIHYNDGNFPPTPDSTRRGQIYNVKRRRGIDVSDHLYYEQETKNGKVWALPITKGLLDVRFALSGADSAGYTAISRSRGIVFRKTLTSAAGYFTKDTVQVDIYNQYYLAHVQAQWDSDSLISAHPRSWNNTNGQVITTINHPTVTAGGTSINMYYLFLYQAKAYDY